MLNASRLKRLRSKGQSLPDLPGVYLMKNEDGRIIYVGKAKNLKNRVRTYFQEASYKDPKTKRLVEDIHDFDIIMTKTEVEALLTERTLIRHHVPPYNIRLRDDKEYPFVRVDFSETWPRLEKVRRRKEDGARYFGPFGSSGQLNLILRSIGRIFPLIRCSRHEFKNAKRPCNYFHMKMCLAPCVYETISSGKYHEMLEDALLLLEGKTVEIRQKLHDLMMKASDETRYEDAAAYRDQIQAIDSLQERQAVVVHEFTEADIVYPVVQKSEICFTILMVRESRLVGSDHFIVREPPQSLEEALESFLIQYYDGHSLPDEIILPLAPSSQEHVQQLFREISHKNNLQILVNPEEGERTKLLAMAKQNAEYQLSESERMHKGRQTALELLQAQLKLTQFPRRMECIDISNMQGQAIVASNVCFIDGLPAKENYRIFHITSVEGKNDDFASMREVVGRRIRRGIEQHDLPDLLVIDGGKGQLNAALSALEEFPTLHVNVVSLAKSRRQKQARNIQTREVERSFERVFLPGEGDPLILRPGSPEFRLLTHIRDEAHRFAIKHHRQKRSSTTFQSELDRIPGVGVKTRDKLLSSFGDIAKVKSASVDQLATVVGQKTALVIYQWFQSQEN